MPQDKYSPPEVGSISPLRSKHARDITGDIVNNLSSLLETEGLTERNTIMPIHDRKLAVNLEDYLDRSPRRVHERHWIDTGKGLAVVHPQTFIPFFLNETGSKICRLCDGGHSVKDILITCQETWPSIPNRALETDLIRFLLLTEELDLVRL